MNALEGRSGSYNKRSSSKERFTNSEHTSSTVLANSSTCWLQSVYTTIRSRNSHASASVRPKTDCSSVHGQDSAFATRTPTTCVLLIPRVGGLTPERITALEREHSLGDVGLDDGDRPGCTEEGNKLPRGSDWP